MLHIPAHYTINAHPIANPDAILTIGKARFTVLTPRLIRIEYSPIATFEDRPSQAIWYREQDVPSFTADMTDGTLTLDTGSLLLRYDSTVGQFAHDSLTIYVKSTDTLWHFGDPNPLNLKGTARTLDNADGAVALEEGLMSRAGWAVLDDSRALVFNPQSWLEPRNAPQGTLDLYFFGHGRAYQEALNDYMKIAGPVPMIPRYILGNWWSRYWEYSQAELTNLMLEFKQHEIPLSVCIVDMDWHITKTGNQSSGWTGYTWNRDLFPDPRGFINTLHNLGLKTALNLHPADGVWPHEEQYARMAKRLGIDPQTEQPIAFDITSPEFMVAYFEELHHPHERDGVDFWWIDWQQGTTSRLEGLDPLWFLNHLHFLDLGRDGTKRPFIFSRWGGYGNHRYPIGFSGDSWVTWDSLAFQPYFTATASNVGFGWWSHDIGGHGAGQEEPELYARWVQYGVFSPILRIHASKNPFHDRRPWQHPNEIYTIIKDAMQLRHRLIPYLYTLAWQATTKNVLPIRPMYYDYPEHDQAYHCPQQYMCGPDVIAAPYTEPLSIDTGMSRQVVWLPEGDWYNAFDGTYYRGGGWYAVYGRLEDIPVFARAGAIVPLGARNGWGGIDNPQALDVLVFCGAEGQFTLYEDDGLSQDYLKGKFCTTSFSQNYDGQSIRITIDAAQGETSLIPQTRIYRLLVRGVREEVRVECIHPHTVRYDSCSETLTITLEKLLVTQALTVTITSADGESVLSRRDRTTETFLDMVRSFKMDTPLKTYLAGIADELVADGHRIADYAFYLKPDQVRALLEITQQVGAHRVKDRFGTQIVLWNNRLNSGITYRVNLTHRHEWIAQKRFPVQSGVVPQYAAFDFKIENADNEDWRVTVDYFGAYTFCEEQRS